MTSANCIHFQIPLPLSPFIFRPNNIPFCWCRRHLRFAPKLSVTGGWSSAADDAVVEEDEDDEDGGGGGGKVRLFDYLRIRFH